MTATPELPSIFTDGWDALVSVARVVPRTQPKSKSSSSRASSIPHPLQGTAILLSLLPSIDYACSVSVSDRANRWLGPMGCRVVVWFDPRYFSVRTVDLIESLVKSLIVLFV